MEGYRGSSFSLHWRETGVNHFGLPPRNPTQPGSLPGRNLLEIVRVPPVPQNFCLHNLVWLGEGAWG